MEALNYSIQLSIFPDHLASNTKKLNNSYCWSKKSHTGVLYWDDLCS